MSVNQKEKGFTIIEVVLVLAIAGLIFLMVFIALPTLQKSQRDTQRKNDLSRIMTQLTSYSSNNRGTIPTSLNSTTSGNTFVQNYLEGTAKQAGSGYQDPSSGEGYKFLDTGGVVSNTGEVGYQNGNICGTDGAMDGAGSGRQYALTIKLEGQTAPYCVDNR